MTLTNHSLNPSIRSARQHSPRGRISFATRDTVCVNESQSEATSQAPDEVEAESLPAFGNEKPGGGLPSLAQAKTTAAPDASPPESDSMGEFYQLKQTLLLVTLALTGIIFISVWFIYSSSAALNYLLGGCVGVVYLRMLAKDIERIGGSKRSFGSTRLALFVGLMIIAAERQQLQILPIFFGFMTYKVAIIIYVLQTTLMPAPKRS